VFPEFKALVANKYKLLLLLIVVITSFWAIGFSNGVQIYLKKKMDNPFVKFITVTINNKTNYEELKEDLSRDEVQSRFNFRPPPSVNTTIQNFQSTGTKQPDAYLRAINANDPLYKFLLNESDISLSDNPIDITQNETSWGIIVTKDYLKKLGYSDLNVGYINYIRPANNKDDDTIPIPVAAVVEQLPDYLNGIVNEKLLISMKGGFNDNPLDISLHKSELCFFINGDVNAEEIINTIQNKFPENQIKDLVNESHTQGKRFVLYTDTPQEDFETIKILLKNHEVIRVYNFTDKSLPPSIESDKPDFITIPFNSLDSVSAFQKYLEENHNNVRIDMNTVEAKNNFNTFDKISSLLGLLLTMFGSVLMISITLNTILNHIEKNKTNLGTLKAFGMSNLSVTIVYTSIAAFLIFSITAIGYVFNKITGSIISNYVAKLGNMNLSQEFNLYILEFNTTLLLIFVLFPILTVFGFIYHKLYNKTPGDLIYDRN
jgi:hypothetical protein